MLREYLNIAALLAVVCAAMVLSQHLDARAEPADKPTAQDRRDEAARHACGPGESVSWISADAHECLRERP